MATRIGEIIITEDDQYDIESVVKIKKIFFMGEQKQVGVSVNTDPAHIAKLEKYSLYALYANYNDIDLAYAIDDKEIILINLISNNNYIFNEEILNIGEDDPDFNMTVAEIVEGHFGGHGAQKIEMSLDDIKSKMTGESRLKLYIFIALLIVAGITVWILMQNNISDEVIVDNTPPPPLVLDPKSELNMKRLASIKALQKIEDKMLHLDNDIIASKHERIASINISAMNSTIANSNEYPHIYTDIQFEMESDYASVGSEMKSEGIYSYSRSEKVDVSKEESLMSHIDNISEACITEVITFDKKKVWVSRRNDASITIAIKDAETLPVLRKLEDMLERCAMSIDGLIINGNKIDGSIVMYGIEQ